MASIEEAFNSDYHPIFQYNKTDSIDYFFTQRKVTEEEEYIDKKNMTRKKKKKNITYNFIAINIPYFSFIDSEKEKVTAHVKIWGDDNYKYEGALTSTQGFIPSLLLKLSADKQLFINIKIYNKENDNEIEKEYVTFVHIPKRYQTELP